MQPSVPDPVFLNVEFIFSWLWGHVLGPILTVQFLVFLKVLFTIFIIIGITIILYVLVRLYEIKQGNVKKNRKIEKAQLPTEDQGLPGATVVSMPASNETWEHVRAKLLSESPSDWRLGIIEADIYLDRVLDSKGYVGDTLGDKLKNMSEGSFPSLQVAWEAHKVRNRIAHDGAAFSLTMPEARRVLSYFEIVFRDLGVIE